MPSVVLPPAEPPEVVVLVDKAARCRRLARQSLDQRASEALIALAVECEVEIAGRTTVDQPPCSRRELA